MRKANVRDLHLHTSDILKQVSRGQIFIIENRGTPVAELRPLTALPATRKLPDRERFISKLPRAKQDSGLILEEERS